MKKTLPLKNQLLLALLNQKQKFLLDFQSQFVDLDSPQNKFLLSLQKMQLECEHENLSNPDNPIIYEVIQLSKLIKNASKKPTEFPADTPDKYLTMIADFYNYNWRGNPEFMHTPNFQQVMANYMKYPIIIARERNSDEILAISTIKYNENSQEEIDPYFPFSNAKYFSITGILVKDGTPHKGMGKKIYELALRGACEYAKLYPETRLMCEIDCRNFPSLRALSSAVTAINNSGSLGESKTLPANILGFYTLTNSENHEELIEAPTALLEVGLIPQNRTSPEAQTSTLEFSQPQSGSLYNSLLQQIKSQFGKKFEFSNPILNKDDDNTVCFYPFAKECSITSTRIQPNGTEKGKRRTPINDESKCFAGPVYMDFSKLKPIPKGKTFFNSPTREEPDDAR